MASGQKKSDGNLYAILGMAAGAAIGAGVALVYSPATGDENRKRLQEWIQSRVGEAQGQVQSKAAELQNKAQQAASQSAEWAGNRATEAKDKAQEATAKALNSAQSTVKRDTEPANDLTTETAEGIIRVVPDDYAAGS